MPMIPKVPTATTAPTVYALHEPVSTFPTVDEFVERHGEGSAIELRNELLTLCKFNNSRRPFVSWVVCPLKTPRQLGRSTQAWLLLTLPPTDKDTLFPKVGDRCWIAVEANFEIDGDKVCPGFLHADRIDNPMDAAGAAAYASFAAFKVYLPTFNDKSGNAVSLFERFKLCNSPEKQNLQSAVISEQTSIRIVLQIQINLTTYNSEIGALHFLAEPKRDESREPPEKNREAFEYLLDFTKAPRSTINLFADFPHLKTPLDSMIPRHFVDLFKALNPDHKKAYEALGNIPAGVHIVSGCPGAGKTHWNTLVAGIASCMPILEETGSRRVKILYLMDVNKPADDVADRMHSLFKDAGLEKRVIRMKSWPSELRKSEYLNDDKNAKETNRVPDFTQPFLTQVVANAGGRGAPTLDQAAWIHFKKYEMTRYSSLAKSIDRMLDSGLQSTREKLSLRTLVYGLYKDTLAGGDFVATTPVTACGQFADLFKPDLVFLDEAPHQRELTTLIGFAYFSPRAWILTGDYRQTLPFVAGANAAAVAQLGLHHNPYARQLLVSTMERAEAVGARMSSLYYNHRGYGNLERLGSELFYNREMVSGIPPGLRYPPSVRHLQNYLRRFNQGRPCTEPRLVVHLQKSSQAEQLNSFFNPEHEKWIMGRVMELLRDPAFLQVDRLESPGRIMIVAPYSAATSNYRSLVRDLPRDARDRVDVRTIDAAQGHQADVVMLDLVRTKGPGFLDDAHRLCVAVTRSRQAEIILMHPGMMTRRVEGEMAPTQHLGRIWRDAFGRGQVTRI